jgi:hypothetical protein
MLWSKAMDNNPKLALDFTTASLDPRVSFTRSGNTATVTNSSGNVVGINADLPRFDYNPVTLACKGLLIEESRINNVLSSSDFRSAANGNSITYWNNTRVTVPSAAITSPGNDANVYKIQEDSTASNTHLISGSVSVTSGVTYSASIFVKAADTRCLRIVLIVGFASNSSATIDPTNGSFGIGAAAGISATVSEYTGGWYRLTLTAPATSTTTATIAFNLVPTLVSSASYSGDGSSGVYAWGAQLEAGAFATSYIPTVASQVTRNADVATMTGTNFSDWWQSGLGGATVQALPSIVIGTRPMIQFDDNTSNEIIALRGNTTNPELYIVDGGTPQAQIDAGTIAANTAYSLTGWWQTNFCAARKDNGARVEDLTVTIPTVTQARLGSDGTNYLNGHLYTINYYDKFSSHIYTRRKNKAVFSVI